MDEKDKEAFYELVWVLRKDDLHSKHSAITELVNFIVNLDRGRTNG